MRDNSERNFIEYFEEHCSTYNIKEGKLFTKYYQFDKERIRLMLKNAYTEGILYAYKEKSEDTDA